MVISVVFMSTLMACLTVREVADEAVGSGSSEAVGTTKLQFVPTATPIVTHLDTKATIEAGGFANRGMGRTRTESFYLMIGECGGAIDVRDAIIKQAYPGARKIGDVERT